jgi:hypothetical protein
MARRRLLIAAIAAAILAAALAVGPGRRALDSLLLLRELGESAAAAAVAPQDVAALRRTVTFSVAGRAYTADFYRTAAEPRAALLLVPGLAPDGKDDRRLVDLAVILARARFAVLVPDIASLRAQRVSAENIREIADALGYLATADSLIDAKIQAPRPLGIAAVSYSVGPALLATLQSGLTGRVDFMVAIGGYHDLAAVVTYFTTGFYRETDGGSWQKGTPNAYGKWLFVGANSDALMDMRDQITWRAIAGRRMADERADIGDLTALLGPEGQSVQALLSNQDPDATVRLIAGLPARLRDNLGALDLRGRDLAGAPRSIILIHGRDDRIIPVSESIGLAGALPAGRGHLYLVEHLAHADLEPGDWRDVLTLWEAAYRLLRLRDGG